MFKMEDWLDCPEDYLWVRQLDGSMSAIGGQRLRALLEGATPETKAEQLLTDNEEWLRTYLAHVMGNDCITIDLRRPLPEWDPCWLLSVG